QFSCQIRIILTPSRRFRSKAFEPYIYLRFASLFWRCTKPEDGRCSSWSPPNSWAAWCDFENHKRNGPMRNDIGIIITDQSDRVCRHRDLYHTKAIETTTGPVLTGRRFALGEREDFRGSASGRPACHTEITARSVSWGTRRADTRRYRAAKFGSRLGSNGSDRSGRVKRSADGQGQANQKRYRYNRYSIGSQEMCPPTD